MGRPPGRTETREGATADGIGKLQGKRVAFLVAPEGTEQVELTEPWKAVEAAGGSPELLSTEAGEIQAFNHLDKADTFTVDRTVAEADASDYDGLVLPGGVANPDFLRTDDDAVAFVRAFFEQAKPVAAICHAPWTLIEADVRQGPHAHLVAVAADRPAQRRRDLGRRGGRRRPGPRHLAQSRRPGGVLRQGRRGALRGRPRRAGAQRVVAPPAAILDVDGTLVDTNYQHALAWYRAFRQHGVVLPIWRIHRHIGMGGDQLVAALVAEEFDAEQGDDVRAAEKALYLRADRRGRSRSRARAS